MDAALDEIVVKAAEQFRLDANLIRAIISTESSWNQWATRYEPNYKYLWHPRECAERLGMSYDTMVTHQKTSWGLMQCIAAVAMELGFQSYPPMLCIPEIGIFYGCKLLRRLSDKYEDESDIVAAYNAGSARKTAGGLYENSQYVDRVYSFLRKLRALN